MFCATCQKTRRANPRPGQKFARSRRPFPRGRHPDFQKRKVLFGPPLDLENFRRAFPRRVGKRGAPTRDRAKSSPGHAVRFQRAGIRTSKKGRSSLAPPWTCKIFGAFSCDASESAARLPATGRKVRPVTPSFPKGPASGLPKKEGPLRLPLGLGKFSSRFPATRRKTRRAHPRPGEKFARSRRPFPKGWHPHFQKRKVLFGPPLDLENFEATFTCFLNTIC